MKEDRKKLEAFISNIEEDLTIVVSRGRDINPELESIYSLIQRAWEDVKPHFTEIKEYISGKQHLEKMEDHLRNRGLTGVQLELKLRVYNQRRQEFLKEWNDFVNAPQEEKKRRRGILGRILGKLLRIIDRILESLGFIPGTDAVKEIKGVLEEIVPS